MYFSLCVDKMVLLPLPQDGGVAQLSRILQYLECPQYMRKQLFPQHKDLQYAGLLNPLDSPHHLRADEEAEFREGIVTDKPVAEGEEGVELERVRLV